jgi:hypothetical protein
MIAELLPWASSRTAGGGTRRQWPAPLLRTEQVLQEDRKPLRLSRRWHLVVGQKADGAGQPLAHRWCVAQATPVNALEARRHGLGQPGCHASLADTAHAEDRHQPTAPLSRTRQLNSHCRPRMFIALTSTCVNSTSQLTTDPGAVQGGVGATLAFTRIVRVAL